MAQLQAAAEKGYVLRQIDLAAAYFIGKRVPENLKHTQRASSVVTRPAAQHSEYPFELQVIYADSERAMRFAASARVAAIDDSHAGQICSPSPA